MASLLEQVKGLLSFEEDGKLKLRGRATREGYVDLAPILHVFVQMAAALRDYRDDHVHHDFSDDDCEICPDADALLDRINAPAKEKP